MTAAIINHVQSCHSSIAKHDYEFDMNAFLHDPKKYEQHDAGRQAGYNYNIENALNAKEHNKTIHMKI